MPKRDFVKISRWSQVVVVVLFALCVSPAAVAQKVTSDYDKTTDFSNFKTYAWGAGTAAPNPNVDAYIKIVIDEDFKAKGLKKVEAKDADLLVAYHSASNTDLNVTIFYDPTYATYGGDPIMGTTMWYSGSAVGSVGRYIKKGTLAIEIYQRREHKVVWAAAAKGVVEEKRADRLNQLDKTLVKLLDRYPPRKK